MMTVLSYCAPTAIDFFLIALWGILKKSVLGKELKIDSSAGATSVLCDVEFCGAWFIFIRKIFTTTMKNGNHVSDLLDSP